MSSMRSSSPSFTHFAHLFVSLPMPLCRCIHALDSRYVNEFAEKKSFDAQRLLRCSWEDLTPSEEDLVREPLLRELCQWSPPAAAAVATTSSTGGDAGVEETKGEEGVTLAETKEDSGGGGGGGKKASGARRAVGLVFGKKGGGIAARFEVLQQVNRKLRDALPFFDLKQVCVALFYFCHEGVVYIVSWFRWVYCGLAQETVRRWAVSTRPMPPGLLFSHLSCAPSVHGQPL